MRRESATDVEPVAGEVVVNEAVAEPPVSRLAGVVTLLDRIFPLLWIGLYLLLPVSGWADEMFESWFDQKRDLEALRALLADGRADAIARDGIGPAYVGSAALIHDVLGLSPESSLVALTRASYALSIAAGLALVRALVVRSLPTPPIVSLASQLVFLALVFAAGTWYWSDVPWSHFFAAFLAVSIYSVRFAPSGPSIATAAVAGGLLALLAATRSFELVAIVLAWVIAALGLRLLRLSLPAWNVRRTLAGVGAFVVTTGVVYLATGKRDLFILYGSNLDNQAGSVSAAEAAQTPTFSLGLVPVKLVQLFVDPCYLSLCQVSDYDVEGGRNLDLWSLPLAVQLPALVLLPLCLVGVGLVVVRAFRWREQNSSTGAVRPLLEMTIAATGLVVGYAGSTLTGPSHLRYGFARDFILPALLVAIVAVVLGASASWGLLARRRRSSGASPEIRFVVACIVLAVGVVGVTTVARSNGLPRIEARHLGEVVYSARCVARRCDVRLEAATPAGAAISIPGASTLTFGCGSDRARLTIYAARLGESVRVPASCSEPRLVAAWPTVMGLPPGSYELSFVDVRNV